MDKDRKLKIVMDFRKYGGEMAGVEIVVYNICKYLGEHGHKTVLLTRDDRLKELKQIFSEVKNIKFIPLPVNTHMMGPYNIKLDSGLIQDIAVREQADLIHFPYNWSFPFHKRVPTVLTIHDLVPFTIRDGQPLFVNKFLYKPGVRLSAQLNDIITTVSHFSKKDIAKRTDVRKNKIRVIYNGFQEFKKLEDKDKRLLRKLKKEIGKDYIMFVGGFKERKNVPRLIKAFAMFVRNDYPGKLVLTNRSSGSKYYEQRAKEYTRVALEEGVLDKVVITDFLPEGVLGKLMKKAKFTLYTSLFEGFGLPILESMYLGVPVITSDVTSMPEVASGGALIADPEDVDDIYENMIIAWKDKDIRRKLIRRGYQVVKKYSWEKAGKQYLDVYYSLLKDD